MALKNGTKPKLKQKTSLFYALRNQKTILLIHNCRFLIACFFRKSLEILLSHNCL